MIRSHQKHLVKTTAAKRDLQGCGLGESARKKMPVEGGIVRWALGEDHQGTIAFRCGSSVTKT